MNLAAIFITATLAVALTGCSSTPFSSGPFNYADERCTGQQNQCQRDCTGIDSGPARSACIERCLDVENACYANGYSGDGSSMAIDAAVGASRSRAQMEADYERWKAAKDREAADKHEAQSNEEGDSKE